MVTDPFIFLWRINEKANYMPTFSVDKTAEKGTLRGKM
jgi:hypothetical protein